MTATVSTQYVECGCGARFDTDTELDSHYRDTGHGTAQETTMKTFTLRNIPEEVHRAAKMRAAAEGTSQNAVLLRLLARYADGETAA